MKRLLIPSIFLLAAPVACNKPEPPPPVHRAVSATVEHFNPGLAFGQPLGEAVRNIGPSVWVQHAGIVGKARQRSWQGIRIYTDSVTRAKAKMDSSAFVGFVELVSDGKADRVAVMSDLAIAFRGVPKKGCLIMDDAEGAMRNVEYWTTPTDQGGAAIISEYGDKPLAEGDNVHWSLFMWSGPFKGGETFLLPFEGRMCDGTNAAPMPAGLQRTAERIAFLQRSFSDSVRGAFQVQQAAAEQLAKVDDATDACMMPVAGSPTTTHSMGSYSIELPSDFTRDESRPAAWRAADRSEVSITSGPSRIVPHAAGGSISSHCENPINGRTVDVDLIDVMSGTTRVGYRVQAQYAGAGGVTFAGEARTQARRLELIRAAYSIRIGGSQGDGALPVAPSAAGAQPWQRTRTPPRPRVRPPG